MKSTTVAFGGDLALIPLFDLCQLLRLNGATGCLSLRSGERQGALYFDRGTLVNAIDEHVNEGEGAAFALFAWRTGAFEFRAEANVGPRVIESSTEAVMMEAARRLDESGAASQDDPGTSETQRLKEHQIAMDALRDVFRRVAGEARKGQPGVDALATTVQLFELSQPEDRLLYRPGHAPSMRRRGRWSVVPEPPVSREDYEELRARLLDACDPVTEEETFPTPDRRMMLADGRALALDLVRDAAGESLWLRPVGPAPFERSALAGDLAGLRALLGLPEALVLLGAADLATARRFLGTAACLATGPADTLVVVSRDGACRPSPESGFALHVTPAGLRATLEAVEPEIVALDPGLRVRDLSLEHLASVPRVLVGVVGHDATTLPARWFSRMAPLAPAPVGAWLESMLAGIAIARPVGDDPATLTISTWPLGAGERDRALRGNSAGSAGGPAPRARC
jgi:hypothetical protein